MNLRDLVNGEMVSVTAPMADPNTDARKAIDANPLTAAVVVEVVGAHEGLESLQRPASSDAVTVLNVKLAALDVRHDDLGRGFDATLSGLAYFCTSESRALELQDLRTFLLPDGLKMIARSYLDEAGHLRNLKSTLSPAHAALMKAIKADDVTLHDRFVEWCEIGEQMRKLDMDRAALLGNAPAGPTRADNVTARNRWIRAMNALTSVARLGQGMSDEDYTKVFGQLDALLARTDRGKKPKTQPQPETPAPAPLDDPTAGGSE